MTGSTFLWNNPVALSSKPKGARKQAADDRFKRYQNLFLEAASTISLESGGSGVVVPLNKVSRKAARRARQREEMLQAVTSILEDASEGQDQHESKVGARALIGKVCGVSAIIARSTLALPQVEEAKAKAKAAEAAAAASTSAAPADQTLLDARLQAVLAKALAARGPLAAASSAAATTESLAAQLLASIQLPATSVTGLAGITSLLANPSAVDLLQQQQKLVQLQLAQAQAAQLQLQLQAQQLQLAQAQAVALASAPADASAGALPPPAPPPTVGEELAVDAQQLLALSQQLLALSQQ